jgi:VanZ family protein
MLIILRFSLQNGEESKETSQDVVEVVVPNYNELPPSKQSNVTLLVRKMAHFSIYLLLGLTLSNAFLLTLSLPKLYTAFISLFTSGVYSLFDEFVYQASSAGRSPQFTDVLIDISGALIGISVYFLILLAYCLIKNKRKKEFS